METDLSHNLWYGHFVSPCNTMVFKLTVQKGASRHWENSQEVFYILKFGGKHNNTWDLPDTIWSTSWKNFMVLRLDCPSLLSMRLDFGGSWVFWGLYGKCSAVQESMWNRKAEWWCQVRVKWCGSGTVFNRHWEFFLM